MILKNQEAPFRTNESILGPRLAEAVDVLQSSFGGDVAEKLLDGGLDFDRAATEPAFRHGVGIDRILE